MGGTARFLSAATLALATSACSTEPGPPRDVPLAARGRQAPSARLAPSARPAPGAGRAHKRTIEPVFEASGVTLLRPGGRAHVSPTGFGCDGAIDAIGAPSPPVHDGGDALAYGARVRYARPELDEWYVVGATSVEQGFSIPAPPPCRRHGGKGVVVALGGVRDAALEGTRAAVVRDPSGLGSLWCSGLHVTDATGRALPASLGTEGRSLAIRFDDTGARYPVTVDPTWQQQAELLGPTAGERFGAAVATSGDTAVVGAPTAGSETGAVYVYVLSGGMWSLQQRIAPGDPQAGSGFGSAVAVAGDVLVVGAPGWGGGAGQAYIYQRSGSTWTQQEEAGTTFGLAFGTAVALDGETMVITSLQGPASVFSVSGAVMTTEQGIDESDTSNDGFGSSVALSGGTLVIGAPSGATQGAAYPFTLANDAWSPLQGLVAPDGFPGDGFGLTVAVGSSTSTVAAAANPMTSGAAYVFAQSGSSWTELHEVKSGDPQFGSAVALGSELAVAGVGADGKGFVSVYPDTSSTAFFVLQPMDGAANDGFGAPLAQAAATVVAAAPGHGDTGAAYVFLLLGEAGDACTTASDCFSEICTGGVCAVPAQTGGACTTPIDCISGLCVGGVCSAPSQAGAACTIAVDCQSGFCVDGVCCTVASCPGADACLAAATCQPGTGTCFSSPTANDGQPCDAGNACAASASCLGGVCSAGLVCPPPDDCHEFGVCDPEAGACSNPTKSDGQPCSTGQCVAGACVAADGGAGGGGGSVTAPLSGSPGGCGCRVGGKPGSRVGLAIVLALAALARRRRAGHAA